MSSTQPPSSTGESDLTLPDQPGPRTLGPMSDHISKSEIGKDAIQDGVEATTHAVGQVTSIVVGAVGEIAKAVGGLATDLFEIAEGSKRAASDDTAP
jgi:hypothetical protein